MHALAQQVLNTIVPALLLLVSCGPQHLDARSSDITGNVFGDAKTTGGIVAAFGDFNSDELTDVFILKHEKRTLEILLGADVDPLLRPGPRCEFANLRITSVVPGDFDGDAYMDLLITTTTSDDRLAVYVNWGASDSLNCTSETAEPLLYTKGEPLALDYNMDMIIDLFGMDVNGTRTFWVFGSDRKPPQAHAMHLPANHDGGALSVPHSHAYLDLNNDFMADLFVTTQTHFEVWHGRQRAKGDEDATKPSANAAAAAVLSEPDAADAEERVHQPFVYSHKIDLPTGTYEKHVGQSLFLDIELSGQLNQVLPICFDAKCLNSTLLVHAGNRYHDLQVRFCCALFKLLIITECLVYLPRR